MSPEEKELLKRSVELGEENNQILRSMRRGMRVARVMSILYWVIIIGSAIAGYYILQPYIDQLKGVYSGASDVISNFSHSSR